jgi:hypothetical protein
MVEYPSTPKTPEKSPGSSLPGVTEHPPPPEEEAVPGAGAATPVGSEMIPFAAPSESPDPPSVKVNVTVFPLITAPGNSLYPLEVTL